MTYVRWRIAGDKDPACLTAAEVKAARPAEDYEPRFGGNPAWTADMFVEAVYTSLKGSGAKATK